ncbi:MAG: TatD family hydrolase [Anaerolineae bacterium]|nr:TatD family hydrolase [Anaerolineae bacterium]MDK1081746.1 TatD family hydrolase [Anaerolineae bacterium]MDK1118435.1 TatD family hydrolase [Anaerolineae bacterium]
MLTDTHCHLDFQLFDQDRAAVIERAKQVGVKRMLIPGISVSSSSAAIKLAEEHSMMFAAVGVHPNESMTWNNSSILALRELSVNINVVAIGEIGLDYYWEAAPSDHQQHIFREQLDLAAELGLPVVIHLREKEDADHGPCSEDAIEILKDWVASLGSQGDALRKYPGVLHSFSSSVEIAERAIALNFFIGVTGPITFKNAKKKQEMIAELPLESLLIETDAPYLAPHPYRGKRNEPSYVREIADKIGQIKTSSQDDVAAITTSNAASLFSWGEIH